MPVSVLDATLAAVRDGAARDVESGVFWMGERSDSAIVQVVMMPRGRGVEERPDQWKVSADVYAAISRWAVPRGMSLLGWIHTHARGIPARLSEADRTRSIRAPGVLAVVIGSGGDEEDPDRWGWYVYESGGYKPMSGDERQDRIDFDGGLVVECWRASLDGVREGFQ